MMTRMPPTRLWMLLLLLCISGVANAALTFRLYNREREPITGASFVINGRTAVSREAGIYTFDTMPLPPYQVDVSAKGFLPAVYKNRQVLPGELSLLRPGEDFYYSSACKVPCVNARHLLIVNMLEQDSAGHALEPDETRRLLESIAAPLHMIVAGAYHDKLKNQVVPKGETRSVMWDHTYLLRLENNKDFPDSSAELAALRGNKTVHFAGPVLGTDTSYLNVYSYKPQVTVSFPPAITDERALAMIDALGYKQVVSASIGGIGFYTIVLPATTGMDMNRVVEELMTLYHFYNVQPELWMIK